MLYRPHTERLLYQTRLLREQILARGRNPADFVTEIRFRFDQIERDQSQLRREARKPRRFLSTKFRNVMGNVLQGRVKMTEHELVPGSVVSPERRRLPMRRNHARTSENRIPRSQLNAVPAPAAPPGRPLLLNRFQRRSHDQPRACASARGQQFPSASRNGRREKLASPLL